MPNRPPYSRRETHGLRFVYKSGKRILQQYAIYILYKFDDSFWGSHSYKEADRYARWEDVPFDVFGEQDDTKYPVPDWVPPPQ